MRRRELLRMLGAAGAGLGIGARRTAQASTFPLRVVFFYDIPSFLPETARPRVPGGAFWDPADTATRPGEHRWELAPGWEPLRGLEDRMINLIGMDLRTNRLSHSGTAQGGGHGHQRVQSLTAHVMKADNTPSGPSIDQYIADGLLAQGIVTPLHSVGVHIGITGPQGNSWTCIHRPDGSQVLPLFQPSALYDRLFPSELLASADARNELANKRRAIASLVRQLGERSEARLSAAQERRVTEHLREFETLQAQLVTGEGVNLAQIPDRSIVGPWTEIFPRRGTPAERARIGLDEHGTYQLLGDVNLRMLAAALHAGITRVAVVQHHWPSNESWGFVSGKAGDPARGIPETTGTFGTHNDHGFHHDVAGAGPLRDDPRAIDFAARFQHQFAARLRHFIDTLALLPEGEGSVLDNTLIILCSEMATPAHSGVRVNWSLIGDAHGRFSTGRTVVLPRLWRDGAARSGDVSHADYFRAAPHDGPGVGELFVAVANAMGVETTIFGHPDACTGELPGLR